MKFETTSAALAVAILFGGDGVLAQGTLADYERAQGLQARARGLVINQPGATNWIGESDHFWYAKTVRGGSEFVLVDAAAAVKKPAFDHEKLAAAINAVTGGHYTGLTLPFIPPTGGRGGAGRGAAAGLPQTSPLTFKNNDQTIEFGVGGSFYTCQLAGYTCAKGGAIPQPAPGRGGNGTTAPAADAEQPMPLEIGGDPVDGLEWQPFPQQSGGGRSGSGDAQPPCAATRQAQGGRGGRSGATPLAVATVGSQILGQVAGPGPEVCRSFDGKWDAFIENYNVFLRPAGAESTRTGRGDNPPAAAIALSFDGSEGNYYTLPLDRLVARFQKAGGLSHAPRLRSPGSLHRIVAGRPASAEALDASVTASRATRWISPIRRSSTWRTRQEIEIDHALFPNAYNLTPPVWWKDSRGFTFEYNQRGHQVYRVIEVDAQTGKARALIDEAEQDLHLLQPARARASRAAAATATMSNDGKEIIWASERDGWEHLYLYDGVTGKVKNQITKGDWVVRNVDHVDDDKRQIWFEAGGMNPGQDPYFTHYYRINFDGTGLTKLTDADGNHTVTFSPDRKYYVDTWSRVDLPPVAQLRRTDDQKVVMDLEKGDASALLAAGFRSPEVFVAKGRDGKTDIWGTIVRPMNFDPAKKYPVIENIYAGPQGSFVPKTFSAVAARPGAGRTGLHRGADRRHGHQQPLQGLPRCGVEESGRRRLPRPHPVAQGRGGEISRSTTSAAWASSAPRRAGRIRWAACCSIPSSTRWW